MGPVRQNPIQRTVSLFICVCIALCTIVAHNIAQNRPDSFPPYPPDNHHCSDDVYLMEGGILLEQSFTARMPLLTEISAFGLERRQRPNQQCQSTEGSSVPKDRLQSHQVHLTVLQAYTCIQYIHKNESKHSEMGPVRQNPIQQTVRSVHMCALHCAQLLHTILHKTDLIIFPLTLQTIIIDPMMSI